MVLIEVRISLSNELGAKPLARPLFFCFSNSWLFDRANGSQVRCYLDDSGVSFTMEYCFY